LKPNVNINFNDVFANTKMLDDLSAVIFGAELALKYTNASEAQVREIKGSIVRSAFVPFSLNYDNMSAAAQPNNAVSPPQHAASEPSDGDQQFYAEAADLYSTAVPDYDYFTNVPEGSLALDPVQSEAGTGNPPAPAYQPPGGADYDMGINNNFEQTVVYENYADPAKEPESDPELTAGYGNHLENTWGMQSKREESPRLGKIH